MFAILVDMAEEHSERTEGRPDPDQLIGLLAADPVELSDAEVTDGMLDLIELLGRTSAALSRFAASFDSRSLPSVDGARSASAWIGARTELSRSVAGGAVKRGRALRACPVVDAAAGDGRLGEAKVRMLLDVRCGLEELFAEHEQLLVDEVSPLTVEQARIVIEQWRAIALATEGRDDGPDPADDPDRNTTHLSPTFGGRWRLDGDLDAVTGDAMATALDAWIDSAVRDGAIDPTGRSRTHLRAQALAALVGVGSECESPRTQRRADIRLAWDAADLLGEEVASMAELAHRRCLTDRGTFLSHFAADEALCNAEVTDLLVRFGLDGSSTVLGTVHTRRYPTDRERAALAERDGGCMFPGCDAPVGWCDAHHTIPYDIGKRTKLDELVLLCPFHHRQVHRGFSLVRTSDGRIEVTRPDGSRLDHDPPGGAVLPDRRHKLPPPTRFRTPSNGDERAA